MYEPLRARLEGLGRRRGRAHAESRPEACEEASVAVVLGRAAERPLPIGIVHCSSIRSANLAFDARRRGLNVTVEVCTPYLFFTAEALDRLGPYAKCNPPLRSAETRDALWHAIQSGLVEYLGTDHSPFTAEDKERFGDDIFKAGVERLAPGSLAKTMISDTNRYVVATNSKGGKSSIMIQMTPKITDK